MKSMIMLKCLIFNFSFFKKLVNKFESLRSRDFFILSLQEHDHYSTIT